MKAIILNCTLKASPVQSNTEALANLVKDELAERDVETETIRLVDHTILPGILSNEGRGDEWPQIRQKILGADILIMASPTWVGLHSSLAQRVIERMDAMLSERTDDGLPVAFNHVAGCVVTGNEDGAKHVIAEMEGALIELGFTVPGWSWTYWNNGAALGDSYIDTTDEKGKQRAARNAKRVAHVLTSTAQALRAMPITAPPA